MTKKNMIYDILYKKVLSYQYCCHCCQTEKGHPQAGRELIIIKYFPSNESTGRMWGMYQCQIQMWHNFFVNSQECQTYIFIISIIYNFLSVLLKARKVRHIFTIISTVRCSTSIRRCFFIIYNS